MLERVSQFAEQPLPTSVPVSDEHRQSRFYEEFCKGVWEATHDEPYPGLKGGRSGQTSKKRRTNGAGNDDDDGGGDDDDDGLVVAQRSADVICPLSRTLFVDPVTSPACGHTFSRAAVLELVKQHRSGGLRNNKSNPRCPIPGCSQRLDPDKLVTNEDVAFDVKEHQRKEALQKKQGKRL